MKVYLVRKPSCWDAILNRGEEASRRLEVSLYDYDCPFSILDEFDQWFEWKRRQHFLGHDSGRIMADMLTDHDRIKSHRRRPPIMFRDYGVQVHSPRSLFLRGCV